jgi:EPS-associated MarR family transcriptional regulator
VKKILKNISNQELQLKLLQHFERDPNVSQRQLSKALGVSLGKTHYLVSSIVKVGWVKLDNFKRSDKKIGYMYLLTPKGIIQKAKITKAFLIKKEADYERLRREIDELRSEIEST